MHATGLQILFLIFAVQFGSMLIGFKGGTAIGLAGEQVELLAQALPFIFASILVLAVPAVRKESAALLAMPVPSSRRTEIALATALKVAVPFGIVGSLALAAIALGNEGMLSRIAIHPEPEKALAAAWTPTKLVFSVAFSWLLGPVLEEVFFRGFLFRAWEAKWGWFGSMTFTSIAFGLFHPHHIASSILASVIFTCVLRRTGSLRACIYVHAIYNVLVFWPFLGHLVFAARPGDPLAWSTWSADLACLAIIAIGVPLYLFLARTPHEAQPARS